MESTRPTVLQHHRGGGRGGGGGGDGRQPAGTGGFGVWRGVAAGGQKFQPDPSLLRPAGGPPLKRPYSTPLDTPRLTPVPPGHDQAAAIHLRGVPQFGGDEAGSPEEVAGGRRDQEDDEWI
jgi:hypothetical protein